MTHRDPSDVILSVATIYADLHRYFSDAPDPIFVGALNVDTWSTGMERLIAFRDDPAQDAKFYDIHFRAMQDDPLGEVRGLYDWLGETVTPAFEEGMKSFWEENEARERFEKPDPSVFGLDDGEVRGKFARYLERMERWAPYPKV
jgi:Sulfotransferase family